MSYLITSSTPAAVLASWPPSKQRAYALFLESAQRLAATQRMSLAQVADALLLFHDLSALFEWVDAHDFIAVLCTAHRTAPQPGA